MPFKFPTTEECEAFSRKPTVIFLLGLFSSAHVWTMVSTQYMIEAAVCFIFLLFLVSYTRRLDGRLLWVAVCLMVIYMAIRSGGNPMLNNFSNDKTRPFFIVALAIFVILTVVIRKKDAAQPKPFPPAVVRLITVIIMLAGMYMFVNGLIGLMGQ